MKEFLSYVARDILDKYGDDLSQTVVVFPNKRASLFLNEHLVKLAGKPLWSPVYITISDLFRQHSPLQVADPIKLVCDLHKSFCLQTGSTESLDRFYSWGQLLLSDFDDIDKNLADPDRVFANLRDLHELDDLSYLTAEQREMLRHFFSHFTEEQDSDLKQRFLQLWSHFADIYHDFNARLAKQQLCYEGALYRQVSTNCSEAFTYEHYLFVGFNLLQKVEQALFKNLQKQGKAHFYWDFDQYYLSHHEAGQYIANYLKDFPNELDCADADIYGLFQSPKQLSYIAAPTEHVQARYISTWLQQQNRYQDGRRTAIVLCNEKLLPSAIHSIPDEVQEVNITTGFPLSQTPIASFIQLYYEMELGNHSPRLKRAFLRHPYARHADEGDTLLHMLRSIATQGAQETDDPLFQESVFRAYTLLNRLQGLMDDGDLQVTPNTLYSLIRQLIGQTSIPFHGEPARGVQVMGILETRNLDFDHVLILSCNEGNLPRGIDDSSFIPHSIRHAYELTTVENKVSIYSYYFHRLIQRASDVTILYNNSTEDGQRGEMSRFMLQLLVESRHPIRRYTLQAGKTIRHSTPKAIEKTPQVQSVLQSVFASEGAVLSPTAINCYKRCPLQFYYRYVAGIREPEQPDDEQELDNRVFGNIFHHAADLLYHQLPRDIDSAILKHLLKEKVSIERAVDDAFNQELPNAFTGGLHIINREVIIRYLRRLVETDIRLAPFRILGLECDVSRQLTVASLPAPISIGGRIDRLDLIHEDTAQERIRVVDYKTGSQNLRPLGSVDDIFDPEKVHSHSDYYLQTFVYADIVRRNQQRAVSPALLFIQHAGAEEYDPTLCLKRIPVLDIADYAGRFNELLEATVNEMFSPDTPFLPTSDLQVCHTCPYASLCRK